MKYSKTLAITTTVMMAAVFASSPALAENISAYRLDPNYVIRSQPKQDSQKFSTIGAVQDEVLRVQEIPGNSKWLKVERPNGGEGYVHKNAMKSVELNPTFVIRSNPSLTSGTRVGSTGDAKRPSDLVLTGQSKVVRENGKTIEWLGVVSKGKQGWVAAGVAKSANKQTEPAKPVAKPEVKKADKPAAKSETKPAAKPEAKKAEPKKIEVKPVPVEPEAKAEAKPESKPATKEVEKPTAPKKEEPKKPEAKPEAKNSDILKQKPVAVEPQKKEEKKPETKTAPGAKPKDEAKKEEPKKDEAKKDAGPECVRTKEEYLAAPRLKKIYGENYDPFVKWEGSFGSTMTPDGKGIFVVDTTSLGFLRGLPRYLKNPTQICADMKTGKPYMLMYGKRHNFDDKTANVITLKNEKGENTYRRAGTVQ